ncbi:hypothetical protein FRACA_780020 [Frankia canadensis]|uniref:Uncharacterized protein n=1 Tax=Frankia canadensis TaxID=1836972 RepID=A0A2I2L158_9ACTN|nr:hypothetical protein FRACA_780020 [Frankia canadensis]SOU58953.1 hypothetical protein FRACA_780020 [Frankia canadensis]
MAPRIYRHYKLRRLPDGFRQHFQEIVSADQEKIFGDALIDLGWANDK